MSLTVTVDEAIAMAVTARLQDIDLIDVVRLRRDPENWTPEDRQVVVVKRSPQRQPSLDCPGNPPAIAYSVQINLRLHVLQSERDNEETDNQMSVLVGDVITGITSADQWYQWDSLALNTELGAIEYINNDGGFDCSVIQLVITYRFSEDNPFEVRA
jgi:hypothetical protein